MGAAGRSCLAPCKPLCDRAATFACSCPWGGGRVWRRAWGTARGREGAAARRTRGPAICKPPAGSHKYFSTQNQLKNVFYPCEPPNFCPGGVAPGTPLVCSGPAVPRRNAPAHLGPDWPRLWFSRGLIWPDYSKKRCEHCQQRTRSSARGRVRASSRTARNGIQFSGHHSSATLTYWLSHIFKGLTTWCLTAARGSWTQWSGPACQ